MRRIVILFDGTWNRPDAKDEVTNVVKLHRAIPETDASGVRQIAHYEIGIATSGFGRLTFLAGVLGVGISARIRSAYRFLCETYQPGDEIYAFGFSRGAFEARSLAAMVALVGLAPPDKPRAMKAAGRYSERHAASPNQRKLDRIRAAGRYPIRIRCVGAWETVGNFGIPFLTRRVLKETLGFYDSELSPLVDVGLQALAIDEPRAPYKPILWTTKQGAALPPGQQIEQVWFAGCHANIGGGYKDSALSDIALLWMAERASQLTGLAVDTAGLRAATRPDPLGEQVSPTSDLLYKVSYLFPYIRLIRQERRGIPALRRFFLRGLRTGRVPRGHTPVNESIHESAAQRFGQRIKQRRGEAVSEIVYRPSNLAAVIGEPKSTS